jgi:hypothetical protein
MSSHHFVKEGQEPALFILDALGLSHAENILEWAPLVIVHERALEDVLLWGIKIDVVIAESVHIESLTETLAEQAPVKILTDENPSDIKSALGLLITLKQTSVYIMTDKPETVFNQVDLPVDQLQVNLLTSDWKWSYIPSGIFKKWMSKGTSMKFEGIDVLPDSLEIKGHLSEVISDGIVEIKAFKPFWIAEKLQTE